MTHYRMPRGMRYSTLEERSEYYVKEFPLKKVDEWFGEGVRQKNTIFAMILGRHTNIVLPEYKDIIKNTVIIDDYKDLEDLREYIIQYLPEGVYYDRNLYSDIKGCSKCGMKPKDCWSCKYFLGQELAFDIDPENVDCPYHGNYEKKMKIHQGLGFCMYEFKVVRQKTLEFYEELSREYSEFRFVYSGRGFHIHIMDRESIKATKKEREKMGEKWAKKYPIDPWVTAGEMRLIRLPYSLHGMVSRICIPLKLEEIKSFDPRTDKRCIPSFLTQL
jgi:DNA primase catalytic subunit